MAPFGKIDIALLLQCLAVFLPSLSEKLGKGNITQVKGDPSKCPPGKEEEFLATLFAYWLGGQAVAVTESELPSSKKSERTTRHIAQMICHLANRVRSNSKRKHILPENARLELFQLLAELWNNFPQLNVSPVKCDPIFHGTACMEHLPTFSRILQTLVADYVKSGRFASMKDGDKQSIFTDEFADYAKCSRFAAVEDPGNEFIFADKLFVVQTSQQIPGWKKPSGSVLHTCLMGGIVGHYTQPTRPIREVGGTVVISNGSPKVVFVPNSAPEKAEFAVITFWAYPDGTYGPGTWYLRTRKEIIGHDLLKKPEAVRAALLG
jgi:hypothetical protein